MSYLVIELTARKTNMLQSLGILAAAPVMPAIMLAHALDRHALNKRNAESMQPALGIKGVGLVHRNGEPWIDLLPKNGQYLDAQIIQRRGACMFGRDTKSGPQQNSMQPMALADVEWTLLLDCEHDISQDTARDIARVLCRMRLAGGVIEKARAQLYENWSDAKKVALRTGHWIQDVTADIRTTHQETDPVTSILKAVDDPTSGWIAPVNLGYALLETPKADRNGARDGKPHAFAEHMIGVVRYVPVGVARQSDLSPSDLWRYGWDGDQFLVTNRPSIALSTTRIS